MNPGPAPFAAGVHIPWSEVPSRVHEWAVRTGGSLPREVHNLAGGFSPGAIARIRFDDREIFFKAVGAELNPDSPDFHRREAKVTRELPRSPMLAEHLATYDDGHWVALAYAAVEGRLPQLPWRSEELVRAVASLERLHEALTPTPTTELATSSDHLGALFVGWRSLASLERIPAGLDEWSRTHLLELADLESNWNEAAAGHTHPW